MSVFLFLVSSPLLARAVEQESTFLFCSFWLPFRYFAYKTTLQNKVEMGVLCNVCICDEVSCTIYLVAIQFIINEQHREERK